MGIAFAVIASDSLATEPEIHDFLPPIRVCLTPPAVESLSIGVSGPYEIVLPGTAQKLAAGAKLKTTAAGCEETGLRIGSVVYPVTRLEIVPTGDGLAECNGHAYRGRLRILRQPGGRLLAVNVLPLEEYLASVVDSEMPLAFGHEARRAQAIVSRTFALWRMAAAKPRELFDLYAGTRSQRYLGVRYPDPAGRMLAGESADSRAVVRDTIGQVCVHNGRIFATYFAACCGGRTQQGRLRFPEAADVLQPVACDGCDDAPDAQWTAQLSRHEAAQRLTAHAKATGRTLDALESIVARAEPDAKTGETVFEIGDGRHSLLIRATELRQVLGTERIHSPRFDVRLAGTQLEFGGRGRGHGVGLCQWGARGLGARGWTARRMVEHYYPGARLAQLRD